METFTVNEFRNYCIKQDSLGDVLYNLKAENIKAANQFNTCGNCSHSVYDKKIDARACNYNGEYVMDDDTCDAHTADE